MFLLSSNYWEFFENMSRVLNLKTGDWENPFFLLLITPPGGPIWDDIHSEGLCFNFLGSPFKSDDQKYSWSKFTTFRANSQESDKSLTFHEKDIFMYTFCASFTTPRLDLVENLYRHDYITFLYNVRLSNRYCCIFVRLLLSQIQS